MSSKMKKNKIEKVIYTIACTLMLFAIIFAVVLFVLYSVYGAERQHALYAFWAYISSVLWFAVGIILCIGRIAKMGALIPTGRTKFGYYVDKKEGKYVLVFWIVCAFFVGALLLLGAIKFSV